MCPKEIPLKVNEYYSKKELLALLDRLGDKFVVRNKNGEICFEEYTDKEKSPDPPPLPDRPPAPGPQLTLAVSDVPTAVHERTKIVKPWPLIKNNCDKCRRCKTDKNSQACKDCWRWSSYKDPR